MLYHNQCTDSLGRSSSKPVGNKPEWCLYDDKYRDINHLAFFDKEISLEEAIDLMWYFWCGPKSPLFGKEKAATFERYFLNEKETHKEKKNPYFRRSSSSDFDNCRTIEKG